MSFLVKKNEDVPNIRTCIWCNIAKCDSTIIVQLIMIRITSFVCFSIVRNVQTNQQQTLLCRSYNSIMNK